MYDRWDGLFICTCDEDIRAWAEDKGYPVLMTAELLWPQLSGLTGSHPANTAKLVWAVVLTAIILALAALSHDYVEQPMRRMIVRKFTPS